MAERALSRHALTCPVCLETFKDPSTLQCGHSYCMDCIKTVWDNSSTFRCPQCFHSFTERPALVRSSVLANVVEELIATGLTAPPTGLCYVGPGAVSCDVCTGRKLKAVKSCLQCLVSYCESHLQPHRDVAVLKQHPLAAPSHRLQENLCSEHHEVKRFFCRTDLEIICSHCSVGQHKGHDTVPSAAERARRKAHLEAKRAQLRRDLDHKKRELNGLRRRERDLILNVHELGQRYVSFLREGVAVMGERRIVEMQLQTVQKRHENLRRHVTELKRSVARVDALLLTADQDQFLMLCPALSTGPVEPEPRTQARPEPRPEPRRVGFEALTRAMSDIKDRATLFISGLLQVDSNSIDDLFRHAYDISANDDDDESISGTYL